MSKSRLYSRYLYTTKKLSWNLKFKKIVEEQWSEMAYAGLVDDPLFADLNAFIDKSQERVTGTVKVKLYKGALTILGPQLAKYALF